MRFFREPYYFYQYQAVAFLDVLGFKNKLKEFESEAKGNSNSGNETNEAHENILKSISIYYSEKANDFISTFNAAVSKLDPEKFSYFLFSDNICIAAKKTSNNDAQSFIELLLIISELFYEFVQRGYFLRGGIDYGLFIDKSEIALGVPLANAHKIESELAIYPRIVLSNSFVQQFEVYKAGDYIEYSSILADSLIKSSCEFKYLNVFNHVLKIDNKEEFFQIFQNKIVENLNESCQDEHINTKYKWLANEFDSFIDDYTERLANLDENFEPSEEFISNVKQQKIQYGH